MIRVRQIQKDTQTPQTKRSSDINDSQLQKKNSFMAFLNERDSVGRLLPDPSSNSVTRRSPFKSDMFQVNLKSKPKLLSTLYNESAFEKTREIFLDKKRQSEDYYFPPIINSQSSQTLKKLNSLELNQDYWRAANSPKKNYVKKLKLVNSSSKFTPPPLLSYETEKAMNYLSPKSRNPIIHRLKVITNDKLIDPEPKIRILKPISSLKSSPVPPEKSINQELNEILKNKTSNVQAADFFKNQSFFGKIDLSNHSYTQNDNEKINTHYKDMKKKLNKLAEQINKIEDLDEKKKLNPNDD